MQKRGLITRIENGLYNIVPLEMGESNEFLGTLYVSTAKQGPVRRCHFEDYRFSEDLDFSHDQEISQEDIIKKLDSIFQYTKSEANIEFK